MGYFGCGGRINSRPYNHRLSLIGCGGTKPPIPNFSETLICGPKGAVSCRSPDTILGVRGSNPLRCANVFNALVRNSSVAEIDVSAQCPFSDRHVSASSATIFRKPIVLATGETQPVTGVAGRKKFGLAGFFLDNPRIVPN